MKTLNNILVMILLGILATLTYLQEGNILSNKHRVFVLESGLQYVYGGLRSLSPKGESDFRAASAILSVVDLPQGPIIRTRGTGVFVADNVLLTAKHVVEDRIGLSGVMVIGHDGVTYTAVEILEDADDDLAVVIVQGRTGPWLGPGPKPALGDKVICIGTPIRTNAQLITTWGRVSSEKYGNQFIYHGFVTPGCSGGPVIIDGKVAGITTQYLANSNSLGFAVPINRLDPELLARIR